MTEKLHWLGHVSLSDEEPMVRRKNLQESIDLTRVPLCLTPDLALCL
jgi:hypothetical protein